MRVRAVLLIVCAAAVVTGGPRLRGQQAISTPGLQPLPTMSAARTAAFLSASAQKLNYLPGEVVVRFKDGVSTAQVQRALSVVRSQPSVDSLEWAGQVAIVRDATEPDTIQLAQRLAAQPEVQYAEPNYIRHYKLTPNDPGYGPRQWNFPAIDLPRAWDINPGANSNVIIAIVDTGVTTVNQTFSVKTWNGTAIQALNVTYAINPDMSSSRFVSPVDFINGLGTTVLDSDGHGTHVSSTAGENTNNGLLDAGIAYNARIMPVKVCASYWDVQFSMSAAGIPGFADPNNAGGCPISAIAQGIQYAADNGAKVINLSLGGAGASTTELQAVQYAVGKGVFVSMAAGNEFQDGNPTEYPAGYGPNIAGAMAVGATNRSGKRAYYSNTGSYIEIAAPGGDDIDSDASGSGYIWQSTLKPTVSDPTFGVVIPTFDQYGEVGYEGTSMATPHVSGLAALLISQGITTPAAVEDAIKKSAKFLGTPSTSNSARSDEFGFGLIQARAALLGMGVKK
jgi:serine protease